MKTLSIASEVLLSFTSLFIIDFQAQIRHVTLICKTLSTNLLREDNRHQPLTHQICLEEK